MGFSRHFILKDSNSNELFGWGYNYFNELGIKSKEKKEFLPISIKKTEKKIISISLGQHHSLILNENGDVESSGTNCYGQIGFEDNEDKFSFEKIKFDFKVIFIGVGSNYSILILENNDTYSFGDNRYGQLGVGDFENRNKPTKINGKFKQVICGYEHNFLIDLKSNYFSFGLNKYGQLFLNHKNKQSTPFEIKLNFKIKKIFAGYQNSFIIDEKNILYSIGFNKCGQLGIGNNSNINILEEIKCFSGFFLHLECGRNHTLASTSTSKLFSFGNNEYGQLGLEDNENRNIPIEIKLEEEKFNYFWCGFYQSFILGKSGFIYSCGSNEFASLGIGNEEIEYSNKFIKIKTDKKLIPLSSSFLIEKQIEKRNTFKILLISKKLNLKSIWSKLPIEIIKEICKFI